MVNVLKYMCSFALCLNIGFFNSVNAKPIKNKYGATKNGKMTAQSLNKLSQEVIVAQSNMSQQQYEDVIADPQKARNDQERLAGLSAREVFILVDRSGSMNAEDEDPTGTTRGKWTRWDSSRVAAESIAELALSLDADSKVDIMLWDGDKNAKLHHMLGTDDDFILTEYKS